MDQGGQRGGLPGENQGRSEQPFVQASERGVAADGDQQVITEDGRRQDQRESSDGVEKVPSPPLAAGEQVGHRQADRQGNDGGEAGDAQTEPEREPVNGHRKLSAYSFQRSAYSFKLSAISEQGAPDES